MSDGERAREKSRGSRCARLFPHVYDQTGRLLAAPIPISADDDKTAIAWATMHVKGLDAEVMDGETLVCSMRQP